jgi:hypothetical protein
VSRAPLLGIVKAEDPCSVCGGKNRFGVDSDWPLLTDHPQRIMAVGCEFESDSATVSCPAHNALGRPKEITMLAIIAAALFLIALVLELVFGLGRLGFGTLGVLVFITAGLLCLALQLAGVGRRV